MKKDRSLMCPSNQKKKKKNVGRYSNSVKTMMYKDERSKQIFGGE